MNFNQYLPIPIPILRPIYSIHKHVHQRRKGGTLITESLSNSNLDSPTRPSSHRDPNSPHLTITSSYMVLDSKWRTLTNLNSDHLPIMVKLGSFFLTNLLEPPHRSFTNLEKTDWDSYTREVEESFALLGLASSCSTGEPQFRKILNSSAKHHIPKVTFLT